jgi:hypothetical protein
MIMINTSKAALHFFPSIFYIMARPSTLSDYATFSAANQTLVDTLIEAGQVHLFDGWVPDADAEKKAAFFDSVRALESNYPGGIRAYVKNAKELLRSSAAGENPFAGMRPEVRGRWCGMWSVWPVWCHRRDRGTAAG